MNHHASSHIASVHLLKAATDSCFTYISVVGSTDISSGIKCSVTEYQCSGRCLGTKNYKTAVRDIVIANGFSAMLFVGFSTT